MLHARSNRIVYSLALLFVFVFPTFTFAQSTTGHPLKVMTRNVYQGTDFVEVMSSTDLYSFLQNVDLTMKNVRATKPAERMAAIAREIADQEPDIVGIQEATVWRTGSSPYELTTEFDMLQMLVDDLRQQGVPYEIAVVEPQFNFTAPGLSGWVSTSTQIAILVRADRVADGMVISNPQKGLFSLEHSFVVPIAIMADPLPIWRGWASIDVNYKGADFRFITLHPEAFHPLKEIEQIGDILNGPAAAGSLPVIMAADFNLQANNQSDPTYASYLAITGQGFTDAWAATSPKTAGVTCCQANNLANAASTLDQRIDLIFVRGMEVKGAKVVGSKLDSQVDGLWPSDHAGFVARLTVH